MTHLPPGFPPRRATPDVLVQVPGPRAHLEGTLRLVETLAALAGAPGVPSAVLRFLDRPGDLPESVPDATNGLKYDAYLARSPSGFAWGVTASDRWEGASFTAAVARLLEDLGGGYDASAVDSLAGALGIATGRRTWALGFDAPGERPRVKVYLQEDRWGAGVTRASAVRAALPGWLPGAVLPLWVEGEEALGVVCVELLPGGGRRLKVYRGGPTAREAARGAPDSARTLAERLDRACPLGLAFAYLTVRLEPGREARTAVNKVYAHARLGFSDTPREREAVWDDVCALFRAASRGPEGERCRAALAGLPGLAVVPTATALEGDGDAADLYCAAWAAPPDADRGGPGRDRA